MALSLKALRAFVLLPFLLPGVAMAEGLDSGDTAWMLTATALVLFMTLPGLALFYGGLVRTKNVLSVLMQCFAIACMTAARGWAALARRCLMGLLRTR